MSKRYTKQFKEDAVRYFHDHANSGLEGCAKNLGISKSALSVWVKNATANNGEITARGSGNYESDAAKENARLRRELKDSQDALEILKKAISILGK